MTSILSRQKWVFDATNSTAIFLETQKISQYFCEFLKYTSYFEYFFWTDDPHSWFISEIIDCKERGYLNG